MSLRLPEKRISGIPRDEESMRAQGATKVHAGGGDSPFNSPRGPKGKPAKIAQPANPLGIALWRPLLASVCVYSTVLAFVMELWRQRIEIDESASVFSTKVEEAATEVIPGQQAKVAHLASEKTSDADSVGHTHSSDNGRPIKLSGSLLRASWSWAQAGTSGIVGDQRQQDVSGLTAEALLVHSVELGQLQTFEFVFTDGQTVRARDCHLEARSALHSDQYGEQIMSDGAVASANGEALTLRCPRDLHVRWSVALLKLASGAEVLRVRLTYDGTPKAGSGTPPGIERLVMWSISLPGCEKQLANATNGRRAPTNLQGKACFGTAAGALSGFAKGAPSRDDYAKSVERGGGSPSVQTTSGAPAASDSSTTIAGHGPTEVTQSPGAVDGSPLLSARVGAWLALEHPRSTWASHKDDIIELSLERPSPGTSYLASLGVVGQAAVSAPGSAMAAEDEQDALLLIRRHFHAYLDMVRASAYRPHLHYSTWYDLRRTPCVDSSPLGYASCSAAHPLNRELVEGRLREVHQQLKVLRGIPLDGLLLDDGWDASADAPWEAEPRNFPRGGLAPISVQAAQLGVSLGVWLSPWGGYGEGGKRRLRYVSSVKGVESPLRLAAEGYYAWFRNLTRELALKAGLRFFKFDGFANGLGASGASGATAADVDALLRLTAELRQDTVADFPVPATASKLPPPAPRKLWVTASTGVWPSPFWLKVADVVWRDGHDLGREGVGSHRQQWITFRDTVVYRRVVQRAPLFPLSSLALGGIIWSKAEEPGSYLNSFEMEDFKVEVRSFFLTGAALQELHVQPELLTTSHWDIIADAANVSRHHSDVLKDSHWIGGDPGSGEAYGYAGFACPPCAGLLTWRNPKATQQNVSFTLRQALALPKEWPGGSRDGVWNVKQLWARHDSAPSAPGWNNVALEEPLSLTLNALEFLAFQALPAGLLR